MASEWLPLGTLGRPHGTRGEIHLRCYSGGPAEHLTVPCAVQIVGPAGTAAQVLSGVRLVPDGYLARFAGMADREAVAQLAGSEVHVARSALAPLGEAEFYVEEIVGCSVARDDGAMLGHVRGTFWNGAQAIMTVVGEDGTERLFPVVADYVRHFDRERRHLVVDPHE